ncbi:MAG TPA: hypothetical protein VKA34_06895 [Balneolales bacterium]|nr:hypothetical protein [Balneolales bacterium]
MKLCFICKSNNPHKVHFLKGSGASGVAFPKGLWERGQYHVSSSI